MWMRARHGLWSTTGLEMTLLADDGSLFFSPGGGYGGKDQTPKPVSVSQFRQGEGWAGWGRRGWRLPALQTGV